MSYISVENEMARKVADWAFSSQRIKITKIIIDHTAKKIEVKLERIGEPNLLANEECLVLSLCEFGEHIKEFLYFGYGLSTLTKTVEKDEGLKTEIVLKENLNETYVGTFSDGAEGMLRALVLLHENGVLKI